MNLTLETMLHGVVANLRERIAPAIENSFAAESARLAALLLSIAANAVDDAAAARAWENAALRAVFADAQSAVPADLGARLGEAARSSDPGLKISELDRENDRLRRLLIELHTVIETEPGEPARAIDARIWQLLRETEERRAPRS